MHTGAMPGEKRGGAKVIAEPVDVGDRSGSNGANHRELASAGKEASSYRERGESMSDEVHE